MDVIQKLKILRARPKFDVYVTTFTNRKVNYKISQRVGTLMGAFNTFLPDGRCISVLKVLQDNRCIHDCAYYVNNSRELISGIYTKEAWISKKIPYYNIN